MLKLIQNYSYFFILFFSTINFLQAPDVTYSSGTTLTSDLRLSLSQRAIFNATLTLNGAGFFYDFPITSDLVLLVNNGFTATLQNLLLRNFSTSNLSLGTGSNIIFGDKTVLQILFDQALTQTLKFSGNSIISGKENIIDMGTGVISVQSNSNLKIQNLNFINLTNLNFGCVDNSGSITFENVSLSIPTRLNWANGSFLVSRRMEILGGGVFGYTSGMSSTIDNNSKLILSSNVTFSYDPVKLSGQAVAGSTNLNFTSTSSWLYLAGCNLFVTSTGLSLRKGSLTVENRNLLFSDATISASQGLCFGDGININNDFQISDFNALSNNITVSSGIMTYQNIET